MLVDASTLVHNETCDDNRNAGCTSDKPAEFWNGENQRYEIQHGVFPDARHITNTWPVVPYYKAQKGWGNSS